MELAPLIGTTAACRAMGLRRATFYRLQRPLPRKPARPRSRPALALTEAEQAAADLRESDEGGDAHPVAPVRPVGADPETRRGMRPCASCC